MKLLIQGLVVLVAALHLWFMVLEVALWQKPIGRKTFEMSAEHARATASLAANQGLYNGFLAAGLIMGLLVTQAQVAHAFQVFFLTCVLAAGVFGAWTVSSRILWIQALPAAVALGLILVF